MVANIASLKNSLSKYLKAVQSGTEIVVMDRTTPVARIVPYRAEAEAGQRPAEDDVLSTLARRGAITHCGNPTAVTGWARSHTPVRPAESGPVLSDVLLDMRREERW